MAGNGPCEATPQHSAHLASPPPVHRRRRRIAGASVVVSVAMTVVGTVSAAPADAARVKYDQVSLGVDRAVALTRAGTIRAWGVQDQVNQKGRLARSLCIGDARTIDRRVYGPGGGLMLIRKTRTSPAKVRTPRGMRFTQVTAGQGFSLALSTKGRVYAWGTEDSGSGAMGISTRTRQSSRCLAPVLIPAGVRITRIATSTWSSLALSSTGRVYQWGSLGSSSSMDGTVVLHHSNTPVAVPAPPGVRFTTISAGFGTFKARGSDGRTYAWGDNDHCQFGGSVSDRDYHPVPTAIPSPGTTYLSATGDGGLALTNGRTIRTWGENSFGELGTGARDASRTCAPAQSVSLPGGALVRAVETAWDVYGVANYAVTMSGAVYGWGDNRGLLGDGTRVASRLLPTRVVLPGGRKVASLSAVAESFFGSRATLALTPGGRIYGWGLGQSGLLGGKPTKKGRFPSHVAPVLVG
jgi:alpha-tubulin suppressor-like RCC1 family protein